MRPIRRPSIQRPAIATALRPSLREFQAAYKAAKAQKAAERAKPAVQK
jgi:hypothetical protein